MRGFICILAFVACTSAGGVSQYGSGVGLAGSPINLGSSGLGYNSGLGVKRVAVIQPTYSSGLSGGNYGSGIGLNQGQYIQKPSIGSGIGLSQGFGRVKVAQPVITGRNLGSSLSGISNVPLRTVSVVQPKLIPISYGTSRKISNVQTIRPVSVSYSKPIVTAQPIRTVQLTSSPIIKAQPIRTIKVVPQPIITKSRSISLIPQQKVTAIPIRTVQVVSKPILTSSSLNLGGSNNASGIGKPISRVAVVQPSISTGNYGLTGSTYGIGRTSSLPISTSSNYSFGKSINNVVSKDNQRGIFFGK